MKGEEVHLQAIERARIAQESELHQHMQALVVKDHLDR